MSVILDFLHTINKYIFQVRRCPIQVHDQHPFGMWSESIK